MNAETKAKYKMILSLVGAASAITGAVIMYKAANGPYYNKIGLPLVIGGMILMIGTSVDLSTGKPSVAKALADAEETKASAEAENSSSDDESIQVKDNGND